MMHAHTNRRLLFCLILGLGLCLWACSNGQNSPDPGTEEPTEALTLPIHQTVNAPDTNQNPVSLDSATTRPDYIPNPNPEIPRGYELISWAQLADVSFKPTYYPEVDDSMLFPSFSEKIRALEGEKIVISGYVIPVSHDRYVLSANPFANCFFCGGAGPESIMELELKNLEQLFYTDEFRSFKGRFQLNDTDLEKLNYVLLKAEALE